MINAPENNSENIYISNLKLNNKDYTKNFLNHSDIINGGIIDMIMSNEPNKQRGTKPIDFPYSMSNDNN